MSGGSNFTSDPIPSVLNQLLDDLKIEQNLWEIFFGCLVYVCPDFYFRKLFPTKSKKLMHQDKNLKITTFLDAPK